MALTQGRLSVAKYEATFMALSKYAITLVIDEEEKCKMFQDGLDHQIKARTRLLHINSYPKLVQAALEAEEIKQDFSSKRKEKGMRRTFSYIPRAS